MTSASPPIQETRVHRSALPGLIAGIILAVPAGWVLAYLSALPYFLGLFFFSLVGLLVGAAVYRFGARAMPLPRATCWMIGLTVALLTWVFGLYFEYRSFSEDAAQRVVKASLTPGMAEDRQLFEESRRLAFSDLASRYPPGGFPGYLLWTARDGTMTFPRLPQGTVRFELREKGPRWIVRVTIGLGLLIFSVVSQCLTLARSPAAANAAGTTGAERPEIPGKEPDIRS